MGRIKAIDKFDHDKLVSKIIRKKKTENFSMTFNENILGVKKYDRLSGEISNDHWIKLINEREYFSIATDLLEDILITTSWVGVNMQESIEIPYIFDTEGVDLKRNEIKFRFYYPNENIAFRHHQKLVFMADQKILNEME